MRLGTWIRLTDGREATVVYNSLIGVGAKLGLHNPDPADFHGTSGDLLECELSDDWPWKPDVLLREPWNGCQKFGFSPEACVGTDYKVIEEPKEGE